MSKETLEDDVLYKLYIEIWRLKFRMVPLQRSLPEYWNWPLRDIQRRAIQDLIAETNPIILQAGVKALHEEVGHAWDDYLQEQPGMAGAYLE